MGFPSDIGSIPRGRLWYDKLPGTRGAFVDELQELANDAVWNEAYDLYSPVIYAHATRRGLNDADSRDVVQSTMIAVARYIANFRYDPSRHPLRVWIYTLAESKIRDHFRRQRPLAALEDPLARIETVPDPRPMPDHPWLTEEWIEAKLQVAMRRTLSKVNPKDYQVFEMYTFHKVPTKEIARCLNVKKANVHLIVFRFRELLKEEWLRLEEFHEGADPVRFSSQAALPLSATLR